MGSAVKIDNSLNMAHRQYIKNPTDENLAELIHLATPLIRHFIRYFSGGCFDVDKLQVGYEGVMKAIKSYDPSFNTSFSTYAGHFIMGEIRHYIRKEMRYYKPTFLSQLQEKAHGLTEKYYHEKGEIPDKSHLSKALNVQEEGLDEIFRAGLVSIDELEFRKISNLHYESFKLPVEDKIVLFEAIRKLSKIKQSVIYSLFFQNRTQQQTADSLGINQRKVSRLLKSSLNDLKKDMIG